ncbi:ubiquitin-like domain-containing protein CIP73 isoform X2 [Abrus precatorius]|uniref:Ubiquitin-like domain-containing protein CIP73 isoform X2 n=1 Tax=Abrus precatorius TaxID=3816 RepID=A0A8B8JPI2_ABRPR|nr:ubiquitin-like domain-containing protein CIP73 isoform X2 [Abrus precatorius]
MGSNGTEKIPSNNNAESSETTIEIKIKTLDSQTYTLRVDKQMPVPALKEQIASVTGVLSERQRLICQGKVLKDDQLLSAYHVEDGHTLHLVARQPDLPPPGSVLHHSVTETNSSTSHGHSSQIAPGVFIETFNLPIQGDAVPPEIDRIVSAVLGSIRLPTFASGSEGIDVRDHDSQGFGRTLGSGGILDLSHPQPEQAGLRFSSDRSRNTFGLPATISLGSLQPSVIPDSLTTLSQYLSHISHEFDAIVREGGDNVQAAEARRNEETGSVSSRSGSTPEGLSSPSSLAEVLLSTRRMIVEQAGEYLLQLSRQLENQADVTDPLLRSSIQSRALRTGVLFYNLGAFLLELGRTTMTLRLGQTPSEAVVNGGPAVFISPNGPNHIMVQPLPIQPGPSFGAVPVGAAQSNSSLGGGLGSSFLPRRIDIQIRRGTSTTPSSTNQEERNDTQSASIQRNPGESSVNQTTYRRPDASVSGEPGVRLVPIRTMVAAVPGPLGRPPLESSGNSIGLYYPVLGRFQHVSTGHANSEHVSQQSSQHHAALLSTPESTLQRQSTEDSARNGSLSTPSTRQEPSNSRVVNINILAASGPQNNQESERQIPSSVLQFLRTLFPGGEIHVEDSSVQGTNAGSTSDHAATSRGAAQVPEAQPNVSDEGIFLSNILREIMPVISQQLGSEGNPSEDHMAQDSATQVETDAGTSLRRSGSEPSPPNPKRQKCVPFSLLPISIGQRGGYLQQVPWHSLSDSSQLQHGTLWESECVLRIYVALFVGSSYGVSDPMIVCLLFISSYTILVCLRWDFVGSYPPQCNLTVNLIYHQMWTEFSFRITSQTKIICQQPLRRKYRFNYRTRRSNIEDNVRSRRIVNIGNRIQGGSHDVNLVVYACVIIYIKRYVTLSFCRQNFKTAVRM